MTMKKCEMCERDENTTPGLNLSDRNAGGRYEGLICNECYITVLEKAIGMFNAQHDQLMDANKKLRQEVNDLRGKIGNNGKEQPKQ